LIGPDKGIFMGREGRYRIAGQTMIKKQRIILVEDQTILREGLRSLLADQPDLEIVGEAQDGLEAIRLVAQLLPDLVLTDLSMPRMNGIEAIREIKKKWPQIKILTLTVNDSEEYVMAALKAGADGYILKDSTMDELIRTIRDILSGNRVLGPSISGKVIEGYLKNKTKQGIKSLWDTLTLREREVLKLISEGHRNLEIATSLSISANTVEKHRANLMAKLNLHSVSALTAYAVEKGLIKKRDSHLGGKKSD
jgi:two-component system, NarL family, response regulator NreC